MSKAIKEDNTKKIPAVITRIDPEKKINNLKESASSKKSEKFGSDNIPAQQTAGSQLPLVLAGGKHIDTDDDYNPFENRKVEHPTSDLDTLIHLLKGSLGTGILAMPLAFKNAGLWFGFVATIMVGSICTYCIHILVTCSHILCRRHRIPSMSYAEIAENAFLSGSESIRKYSRLMRFSVNSFLVLDLVGCCCIYIVFITKNLKQIVDHYAKIDLAIQYYMLAIMIPLILICLIRNLKFLTPFSMVANVLILVGIIITMYYLLTDIPSIDSVPPVENIKHWPMFFGSVIFALEGIGVVMSLENDMKNPTHFIGCPSVLNFGMGTVVALYTMVGFFGYWKYGDKTCGSISLNIPTEEYLAQSVKLMIAVAIFLTYALQFYVPINILWSELKQKVSARYQNNAESAFRAFMVVLTVSIAAALPNIGPFITLIGAVCLSTLGLMIPAIIELITYQNDPGYGPYNWRLYKNGFLICFGILGFFTGVYVSIEEFASEFNSSSSSSDCN